jgi:hypothetical protein
MNPFKYAQMMKYLTRAKKQKPDLPEVFPASQAPIPPIKPEVKQREAINEFIRRERQKKAGGGMLVQPGFGGTRQGYKTAKRIESNIGKTDLGKYEVKYKNKQIGTFDKISDAREALSIAKENDPPIPRKDVQLKGQVSFRSIVEQIMDDLLEEGYDAFSTADINSKLPKKIKNQYGVTNKTILRAIKTNRKLDKFKDFKFVKGTGLNQVKPLTKNKQKILIESFPEIDFDFTTGRKYGIDKTSDPVRWKKIKDFIEMPSEGLFPYGVTSKDGLWNSLYRSTISGDRWQLISKVPKNWRKGGAWRKSKFKDTLTGQTITYDNLEKYVDSQGGKGTYKNSLKSWENRKALTDAKIIFKGKEQSLGGVLNQQAIAKFGKEIPSGAKNVPFFGAFQIAHKQGVGNNFWDVEVAYRDANLKLNSLNKQLLSELKGVDNLNQRKKIIKNYSKQIKALPGGASFMFEGQELGKAPTLRSATEAAFRELGLSRTLEANRKQIEQTLASFSNNPKCIVTFGKKKVAAEGGRIGYATGPASLTECAQDGARVFNDGKFKTADQVQDAAKLLRGGRAVVSGLMKYGIIPELAYVGLEAAGRTLLGEQPTNALLKSIDTLTFGATDFGSGIEAEKFGKFSDQKLAVDKFKNSQALVNSLQSKLKNLEDISNQGGEGYIGDLTSDIQMTQAQLQTAQKALQENTVSSDIVQFIDRKGQEIADTQMAKSNFAKQSLKDQMEGIPGIRDYTDTESTRIFPAQPSQMDLNLNMFPTLPTGVMELKTSDAIDLAQALRAEGQNVSAKDILAYRDDLKSTSLSELAKTYGDEQIYGTQGAEALQPLAGGGIAKMAGVSSGPPPKSGPNSQGLQGLMKRVRNL